MSATQYLRLTAEFPMHRGGVLHDATLAYETWGELTAARDNAVLVCTGLSPSAHAASSALNSARGWWEDMIGPGRAIDTDRFFVVCVNSLGSCFGSTGPASINPASGDPYRTDFPVLSLEDIAEGCLRVLASLGVERLHTIVGPSMGGMTALALQLKQPEIADRFLALSTVCRAPPFSIALRSLQREIVRRDPQWAGGNYESPGPLSGMRLARKLGMISYRSAVEWRDRFGRERVAASGEGADPFGIDFEVESYLEHHAMAFSGEFDANAYLYLSRAMDLFDVADYGGSVSAALSKIRTPTSLVIGVPTDILFPFEAQEELARGLDGHGRRCELIRIDSPLGHDAFLADMDRFRPVVADFFT